MILKNAVQHHKLLINMHMYLILVIIYYSVYLFGITTLKKYIFMTRFIFLQCSAAVFPQIQALN